MTALDSTLIAPWASDTPDLLTRTLSHTCAATVTLTDGTEYPLELQAGSRVSFSENRAPRVEATLVCRLPDTATLELIDARTPTRVKIDAGYIRPNGLQDIQPLVDLGLRSRAVSRPRNTLTIVARSNEAIVIDDAPTIGTSITGTNYADAIQNGIRRSCPGITLTNTGVAPGSTAVTVGPVVDQWDSLVDLADRVTGRVYDNGLAQWVLAPATSVAAAPALALTTGATGTITDIDDEQTRDDDWHNQVALTYQWRDKAGLSRKVTAVRSIQTGAYAATAGNVKTLEQTREVPTSNAEALTAAAAVAGRAVTRGRSVELTSVSAYWLRPGHTVEVTVDDGPTEPHLVSTVTFDLAAGLMTTTSRQPDNVVAATSAASVLVDDDFERANGSLGIPNLGAHEWSPQSFLIADGMVEQTETTSTVKVATIQTGVTDHDVEADQQWVTNSGVGLMARVISSTTYLLFTSETGGTVWRLYKVIAGTATQLATSSSLPTSSGVTYTARIKCLGNLISCYVNGTLLFTYDMTGNAHQATLAPGTVVGIRNARPGATTHHYTLRFTVKES